MNNLNKIEKKAIIHLMNSAMCVDNDINILEIELITSTSKLFKLSEEEFEHSISMDEKIVNEVCDKMSKNEKIVLLKNLVKTIAIDKKIAPEELNFIQSMGKRLGLLSNEIELN